MRWRRIRRLVALLTLLTALIGCGNAADTLEQLRAIGTMRVAIDPSFPPFAYIDEDGTIQGLDADLAHELGRRLDLEIHFVVTGWDGLYDALTAGQAEIIISALYPDPTRTRDFAFSRPYFNAGSVLVIPQGSPIEEIADLTGRPIGVVLGTEGHMEALGWEEVLVPPPTIVQYESAEAALDNLTAENVEAIVVDNLAAQTAKNRGMNLDILQPPLTDEPFVVVTRLEDEDLTEVIDDHLAAMIQDGTLETLHNRWMQ